MKIYKAYKFRMYPDKDTEIKLNSFMGTSRFIYNHYLDLKDKYYNDEYDWLKDIDSMVSRNALDDLDRSYTNFFLKRSSHPKFKCKNNHDTYRTNAIRGSYNGKEYSNIKVDLENKMIKLPRLDSIKIRGYRNLKTFDDKKILNATVSKEAGKYYVSVCTEEDITLNPFILRYVVGIDLGVKNLVITSDGVKYDAMNKIDKYEKKIKGLNRWLARSKKGSKNKDKIKLKLQRAYQKLRNARKWECSKCHSINDRDINASINILMEGIEKYYKEHIELVK